MSNFIKDIKEQREKSGKNLQQLKEDFKKDSEIFHDLANALSDKKFKRTFQRVRDSVNTDSFYMARLYLAEIASEIQILYELVDLMDKDLDKKKTEITDEMEDKLYNIWGIRDLRTGDEIDAVFAAKELYPNVHGLNIIGLFSNFCDDNRC